MAFYTIKIVNKGKVVKEVKPNYFKPVMFIEFELVGEGYRDRIEMGKYDLTTAKKMINDKVKKFLSAKFKQIEYQVDI